MSADKFKITLIAECEKNYAEGFEFFIAGNEFASTAILGAYAECRFLLMTMFDVPQCFFDNLEKSVEINVLDKYA